MKNKLLRKNHVVSVVILLLLIISMFSTIGLADRNEIKSNIVNENKGDLVSNLNIIKSTFNNIAETFQEIICGLVDF